MLLCHSGDSRTRVMILKWRFSRSCSYTLKQRFVQKHLKRGGLILKISNEVVEIISKSTYFKIFLSSVLFHWVFCLGPLPSNSREVPGWSRWVKVGLNIASLKYSCGFPGTTRHLQDRAVTYPATSPRRETFFQGLARAAWFSFSLHLPGSVAWLKPLFRKWHSDQGRTQGGTVRREQKGRERIYFCTFLETHGRPVGRSLCHPHFTVW